MNDSTIFIKSLCFSCLMLLANCALAQEKTVSAGLVEGTLVAGYVDKGAYINCVGPNIKWSRGTLSVAIGLLPSIRIKKDRTEGEKPHNPAFTPTLGTGLTMTWRRCVLQVPLFYQPKSGSENGKWMMGIGIGWKFNAKLKVF